MPGDTKRSAAAIAVAKHWTRKRPKTEESYSERNPMADDIIEVMNEDESSLKSSKYKGRSNIFHDDTLEQADGHQYKGSNRKKSSSILLLYNPSFIDPVQLETCNQGTVTIEELIGTKDLLETYQFNFSIDVPFFLTFFHPDFVSHKRKITLISGGADSAMTNPSDISVVKSFNLTKIVPKLANRFGTHHTKMMVNFFDKNTVEIVIMTANLTKLDFGGLTQMCWRSGRLKRLLSKNIGQPRFKKDLQDYILRYNNDALNVLADLLGDYDFSSVDVELIASAPGSYDISGLKDHDEIYGYGKLYQTLRRNKLLVGLEDSDHEKKFNILAQVSSISYPFATQGKNAASIFTHLLCPLAFSGGQPGFSTLPPGCASVRRHMNRNKYLPHIIYPSLKDVTQNNVGFGAGQAVHFNYSKSPMHRTQFEQNIKPFLRRWDSTNGKYLTGRETVVPHVKIYICDNGDNFNTLRWLMMGSHNLSKQAWGSRIGTKFTTSDSSQYEIASYELGVLVFDKDKNLKPSYTVGQTKNLSGSTSVILPFKLPPLPYRKDDQPWSPLVDFGSQIKDNFGNTYNGMTS